MITSPLNNLHRSRGAHFASNPDRPAHHGDPSAEYRAARHSACVIDRTARGRVEVSGKDRLDLLQRLTTNDLAPLAPGDGAENLLISAKGRILEHFDLLVLDDRLLLSLTGPNAERASQLIDRFVFIEEVTTTDVTEATVELLIAGPEATRCLTALGATGAGTLTERSHLLTDLAGRPVRIGRAEPLAGTSFRLIASAEHAIPLWQELVDRQGLAPAGAEAEEILRIEAGLPGDTLELSERMNPLEIGLEGAVSFTKGCYTGQEVVLRLRNFDKVQRTLRGLRLESGTPPAPETPVAVQDDEVGLVTSSAISPGFPGPIALALMKRSHADPGTRVVVGGVTGAVIELPFTPAGATALLGGADAP